MPNGKTMPAVLLGLALVWGGTLESATAQDLRLVGAAADQDARTVRALLDEVVDVNATRGDGATALLWAAHWDNLETAELLLHADANPNAADDHGVTPLGRAAENASAPPYRPPPGSCATTDASNVARPSPRLPSASKPVSNGAKSVTCFLILSIKLIASPSGFTSSDQATQ